MIPEGVSLEYMKQKRELHFRKRFRERFPESNLRDFMNTIKHVYSKKLYTECTLVNKELYPNSKKIKFLFNNHFVYLTLSTIDGEFLTVYKGKRND